MFPIHLDDPPKIIYGILCVCVCGWMESTDNHQQKEKEKDEKDEKTTIAAAVTGEGEKLASHKS